MFHSSITKFAAVAFGAALLAQGASAQNQAHTPVKIIIGFPAGGALDNLARAMAEKLRTDLGRTVSRGQQTRRQHPYRAHRPVKRAPADGATILISPAPPFVTHPLTYDKLQFDPDKELIPVAHLADTPLVATTSAASPYSFDARIPGVGEEGPKDTSIGMVSMGGVLHFGVLQLNQERGLSLMPVAYKGAPPMLTDEIGGVLPVGMDTVASASELEKAGKIKYLGVPGMERTKLLPNVPTFEGQGVRGLNRHRAGTPPMCPRARPRRS